MGGTGKQASTAETASALTSADIADRLFTGHAAQVLARFPDGCIDLVVTSPPYWTAVGYDGADNPWSSCEAYLADMLAVW
jgi:DNA modification methylase